MNITIVENDVNDCENLLHVLQEWGLSRQIVVNPSVFRSSEEFFSQEKNLDKCDVCILDIQLSDPACKNTESVNGIVLAQSIRTQSPYVPLLFLTGFQNFVFEGYKVHAMDYLLKPVTLEKISSCLDEICHNYFQYYYLRTKNEILKIPFSDIISFSSMFHTVTVATIKDVYTQYTSLEEVLSHLPKNFVRCHRSCVVNLAHIYRYSSKEIQLANRTKVKIGRTYSQSILRQFSEYAFLKNTDSYFQN